MVRILPCHHFQAQRTGRTEEPVAVDVVDDSVIVVGSEHRINIYYLSDIAGAGGTTFDLANWLSKRRKGDFGHGEFGSSFTFTKGQNQGPNVEQVAPKSLGPAGELRLSHYFAPIGILNSLAYNVRGHYLITLERQEALSSVRVYFKWDKNFKGKPLTARIAGLVSPTTNREAEENSLLMIEMPASPSFSPKAVATCQLTGNIAALSTDLRVSIYNYKVKEGRLRTQYGDFDLIVTVQLFGMIPDKIAFSSDYIACLESTKAFVFRITRAVTRPTDLTENDLDTSKINGFVSSTPAPSMVGVISEESTYTEKVVFNKKNDSVKVFLNTITRANRKKKQPNSFISEELHEDITVNKSQIIFLSPQVPSGFVVEDVLRIYAASSTDSGDHLLKVLLDPVRVKDTLGGTSFVVATSSEAFLYHLPSRRDSFVVRESTYSFTSTMVGFVFDSLFFHALTATGLETFTSRNLFNALKDTEEFAPCINDCPLHDESPVLIGLKPFIGPRLLTCNEYCLCILTSPAAVAPGIKSNTQTPEAAVATNEDNLWTMYALRCPSLELLTQDIMKEALTHQLANPDAYFALICELHLILRTTIAKCPDTGNNMKVQYKKTCELIGFEYFRKSTREILGENELNELLEKGITYLKLSNCSIQQLFSSESKDRLKDPQLISGILKFIDATLPRVIDDSSPAFSPTLSKQILEFLALNSSKTMVSLVINVPWLRECNSKRLLEILNNLVSSDKQYSEDDCLALILTLVTIHGCDSRARRFVKDVLDKLTQRHLKLKLNWNFLLERKKNQLCLSDLLVCLSSANSDIHVQLLSETLRENEIGILDVLLAFSHGMNLNADPEVQKNLGRDLHTILENHFFDKFNQKKRAGLSFTLSQDEEIRALHALARSYLTHITTNTHPGPGQPQSLNSSSTVDFTQSKTSLPTIMSSTSVRTSFESMEGAAGKVTVKVDPNWLRFGKIPEFVNCIIPDLHLDGRPHLNSTFPTLENKEYFVKLASLLGSSFGRTPGLEELIDNILKQQGHPDSPVHICLRLLSESPEQAIITLMSNYPTVLMLYAKEMFGKSTKKWKTLVTKLKDKIKSQPVEVDIFTTIIEGVYLHLANTLSPSELEHVLDKKDENAKFHAACERIDLANAFTSKVIVMAEEYLKDSK